MPTLTAENLRETIAKLLEAGAPIMTDGSHLTHFECLFGGKSTLPDLGLRFDEHSGSLIAEPFARAFEGPFFIPFDFDLAWKEGFDSSDRSLAIRHLRYMAVLLRHGGLPTVAEAIAERTAA